MLLAGAGCSSKGTPDTPGSTSAQTITLDAAKQRVQTYVDQIAAIFPVKPQLVPNGALTSAECQDPDDGGPKGRYDASIDYFLRGVPAAENPAMFAALRSYASQNGYKSIEDNATILTYQNPKDGFRVGMEQSVLGGQGLSLTVSAPCVWPNGTPSA
ncbi:hypothetical protein GCM10009839_13560 [Catenulispora yoronensis]|uniref:LppA-like lipoprotein n=1 Tax=Catenulispora yoronensis TaxID=450799 RepID=A0ABP5F979_9ACTN